MRAIIQRVLQLTNKTKGSVTVQGNIVGTIGPGIHVLLGISKDDTHTDSDYIIKKILSLKLFSDVDDDRWCKNIRESDLEILVVSQFTLYGNINKGTKPDFSKAMRADASEPLYNEFVERLRKEHSKIQTGKFGSHMKIDLKLDGPVTILVESPQKKSELSQEKETSRFNMRSHDVWMDVC